MYIGQIELTEQLGGSYITTVTVPSTYSTPESALEGAKAFASIIEYQYSPYTNMSYTAKEVSL